MFVPVLLQCSAVSKFKDFLDQKYYSSSVVEFCQDTIHVEKSDYWSYHRTLEQCSYNTR